MIPTPVEVILLLYFFLSTIAILFGSARRFLQVPEALYEDAASKKTQLKLPQNRVVLQQKQFLISKLLIRA